MASLKFIMDTDDEEPGSTSHMNKKDVSSSIPAFGHADPSASSHAHSRDPNDRLSPATTKRRAATGRHSKSSATVSSSSSSTTSAARPAQARRSSSTGTEEMDRYGGHTPGSMSNTPMRPMGAPTGGDVPIKLTPITGRVSRAKKGVPVHICEICRPVKTFTRAEHLRRHQLSHQTPGHPCTYPGCDRAFHRADLLIRHTTRHEQEGDKASPKGTSEDTSRRTSTTSTDDAVQRSYLQHGSTTMGGRSDSRGSMSTSSVDIPPTANYPHNHTYQAMNSQNNSSGTAMSPPQMRDRSGSGATTYTLSSQPQIPLINNQAPSVDNSPTTTGGVSYGMEYQPRSAPSYTDYELPQELQQHLPSLTIPDNNPPGLLQPHEASPYLSSDSNFSTPSERSQRRSWAPRYESPTSDWPVITTYPPTSAQGLSSPGPGLAVMPASTPFFVNPFSQSPHTTSFGDVMNFPLYQEEDTLLHHGPQHLPFSSVRSPSPAIISSSVQSAESLVTLAPALSDNSAMVGRYKDSALLGTLSSAAFLTAITLPRPVRNAIPNLLTVFWERFDPLFPIIHRRSFEAAPNEILRCAMAAMATQYLEAKDDRLKGTQLHEFAWQEARRAPEWDVQTMQAILLCEFFARFRGRKAVIRPSQPFQSLYSRDHLFSLVLSTPVSQWHSRSTSPSQVRDTQTLNETLGSTAGAIENEEQLWPAWIQAESRRRLLAACFVLDIHTSVYYEQPRTEQFPSPTPPIPLLRGTEELWAAPCFEDWSALLATRTETEPSVLPQESLTLERIASAPTLDRAVFLASEVLRLPKRSSSSTLDFSADVDESIADRITALFPGSAVAYTSLALHYTPLHDLLSVSGDSWVFTHKVLSGANFQQQQKRLKAWSSTMHAAAAAKYAAMTLISFFDSNNGRRVDPVAGLAGNQILSSSAEEQTLGVDWEPVMLSDYWAIHVCALILWALGHQANRGAVGGRRAAVGASAFNDNKQTGGAVASEAETIAWLHVMAGLRTEEVFCLQVRGRPEIWGVVALVRSKLEAEAQGSKSRLLIDCLGVLRKLEKGVNWK